MKALYLYILFSLLLSVDQSYISLDKDELLYDYIEYLLIKENMFDDVFIFTQPYKTSELNNLINYDFYNDRNVFDNSEYYLSVTPGVTFADYNQGIKPYFRINPAILIGKTSLSANLELDKRLLGDNTFHGDTDEIITGYLKDAYIFSRFGKLDIFGGRLNRNYGILNEYSLIFSDNPYPFDHYGFELNGNRIKYSFFIARLNNEDNAIDSQGILIPEDSVAISKRYFSFQNINIKASKKIQLGLSQSIIYGGPYQNFEGAYINPINIYYLDQRNSQIQLNGLWQFSLFYKNSNKTSINFDFLIDDFIINNDSPNERQYSPDRLGVIVKYSWIDLISKNSNSSITYTRISNQTYTSFRNFENYTYQLRGIGFPLNSFESIKLLYSKFKSWTNISKFELEFSRIGDSSLGNIFIDSIFDFPISPITYRINIKNSKVVLFKNNIRVFYEFLYRLESEDLSFNDFKSTHNHNFKIIYEFKYGK